MSETTSERKPPRGIRKGGTRFPRYSLKDALPWARKLVSKTHLGPEPKEVIFAGVVGSAGSTGEVKVSALKQFGLIEGPSKAYVSTDLARRIASAPDEELPPLLRQAALAPSVFEALFRTYHGDEVPIAKLRQRASELKVHPDETERCAKLYVESLEIAGLLNQDGELVCHVANREELVAAATNLADEISDEPDADSVDDSGNIEAVDRDESADLDQKVSLGSNTAPRAVFNVNVSLDSSLDIEKLERQLKVLKRYGAI